MVKSGVNFDDDVYNWLKATGNLTGALNQTIRKVMTGQFVDAAAIANGKSEFGCIYNMPSMDEKLDMKCPVKVHWPDLAKDDKRGDLLTCCRQCPRKAEYLLLKKMQLKYPTAFKQRTEEQPQQETGQSLAIKRTFFMCKNGCGTELFWQQTAKGWAPIEKHSELLHVCPKHNRPAAPVQQEQENSGRRVKCSDCGESLSTYMHGDDALDSLLDLFSKHINEKHSRIVLSEDETRQFRALRVPV